MGVIVRNGVQYSGGTSGNTIKVVQDLSEYENGALVTTDTVLFNLEDEHIYRGVENEGLVELQPQTAEPSDVQVISSESEATDENTVYYVIED